MGVRRRARSYLNFSSFISDQTKVPQATASKIAKEVAKADVKFPAGHERACVDCGVKLGRYNLKDRCYFHYQRWMARSEPKKKA